MKNYMNLHEGEVLAFSTDTVWGFGCLPEDKTAAENIYRIKNRDSRKPLILMSDDFEVLKKYIKNVPNYAYKLIEKYLPGGLTLIFEKSALCPDYITSFQQTVGVRIPDSEDFKSLIKNIKQRVLATTSCNITNEPPVKNYKEAKEKFGNCATIIKPITDIEHKNLPSTVILCNQDEYKILRQGSVKLS